ncbi:MAG: response regulator, partial [Spirochaetia bacterium]
MSDERTSDRHESELQEIESESELHVLLVDDEPDVLNVLSAVLNSWAETRQLHFLRAESGEQALQLLESHGETIWIMLTDLKMPGMSGSELLRVTAERHPLLVSLVLTGETDPGELSRSVSAGIFGYIPKPWDPETLIDEVDRTLEYAKARRDAAHHLHALESELRWAGELQQQLLKVDIPVRDEMITNVEYRPLPWLSCGGDYYDVIPYGDDSVIVLIGDVAGHGVKAAFVTAVLKSIIYRGFVRESLRTGFSPAAFLHWLNGRFL